jgi:hypothetical protein
MKSRWLLLIIMMLPVSVWAQTPANKRWSFGLEQDFLPYATGGYFAAAWAGKDHLRGRVLMARVHKPGFILKKGFTNNRVTAYAITADYFPARNWEGWWLAAGLVYWKNSIQADTRLSTAYYNNTLLNGSLGYNWKLNKHFYIGPWAGMHVRVAGASRVSVDGKEFTPPLLNPEGSIKIGAIF